MKRVLISGGARGIGRALVEYFTAQGYAVAFIYRQNDEAASIVSAQTGARAIRADLSDAADAARAAREAKDILGGVDILINNAGVASIGLFTDVSDAQWRQMIDTNLSSAFYLCRAVAKDMISQKWGRIVNVGSMWGKVGASCEVHYSASKAALRGMTLALAKEVGPSGITVNAIEPGVIATDMNSALTEDILAELKDETPLGRIGTPNDVASLALFLASDGASFITGQIIGVDGGFAI